MTSLRKVLLCLVCFVVVVGVLGMAGAAHAAGRLAIYNWIDYIPHELIDKFAAEHDVEVTVDTYNSNESMLASLKGGALGTYDVAFPSDYMVEILARSGLLDRFEREELRNFDNIAPEWIDVFFDPGRRHSIPYQLHSTSFAVNTNHYVGDINTLALIFQPPDELSGKINVLDSPREVLGLALLYLGMPLCTDDEEHLERLDELLQSARSHWASFGSYVAKDVLVSGEASVGMIWSHFSSKAREQGASIQYVFPREGYIVWMDNVVLLKDAPNRENAVKFMNFLLEPENAAAVTNFTKYTDGVIGTRAYYSDAVLSSPESNPPLSPTGSFVEDCPQEVQERHNEIWDRVRR